MSVQPPVELRELVISHSYEFVSFPSSIGRLQHLRKISMIRGAIEGLPEEFCRLQWLEHLELRECEKLKSLPGKFGDLKNLRYLDLSLSGLEELPTSLKQLINLQYIYLKRCWEKKLQPDILENMTKLVAIDVSECELQELPAQITNQGSLEELNVCSTSLLKLPNNIGQLSKLRELIIGSSSLKTLPPSFGNLSSLTSFQISSSQLESLPGAVTQLTSLHSLHIRNCPSLRELDILSGCFSSSLCSLKYIDVAGTRVSRISISQKCCPILESLSLYLNHHLVEINSLPISVKTIELTNCKKLKSMSGICGLINLEKLLLRHSGDELEELPNFEELLSLKEFEITLSGEPLKTIEGLEYSRSLERLIVQAWWKVPVIKTLQNMKSLRRLALLAWNDISALQPCLQTVKKWPSECIICARVGPGVEAAMMSLTLPDLTLVDACFGGLTLQCEQRHSSNVAVLLCFVINIASHNTHLSLWNDRSASQSMIVQPGKWLWMAVFTQSSPLSRAQEFTLVKWGSDAPDKDTGMLIVGEEERVVEAFSQIITTFGKSCDNP